MNNNNAPTFHIGGTLDTNYSYGSFDYSAHPKFASDSAGNLYIAGINFKTGLHEVSSYDTNGLMNSNTVDLNNLAVEIANKLQVDVSKTTVIQDDGKKLVATRNSLSRFNSDSSIDTSFGQEGIIPAFFSPLNDKLVPREILLSDNGEILILSEYDFNDFVLLRYTSDGVLDSNFNHNGYLELDYKKHVSFDIQEDGKILVYGKNQKSDATITRLHGNGTLDTSFGIDGIADLSIIEKELPDNNVISLWAASTYDTTEQADGKILVTGTGFIARLNADGSLDESFGFGGINAFGGVKIEETTNQQILLATRYGNILKFNPNGHLDKNWSTSTTFENNVTYENIPHSENWINLNQNAKIHDAELAALDGYVGNYDGVNITIQRKGGAVATDEFTLYHFGQIIDDQLNYNGHYIGNIRVENGRLDIDIKADISQQTINYLLQSIAFKTKTPFARDTTLIFEWTFSDGNDGSQGTGGVLTTKANSFVTIEPYLFWKGNANVRDYLSTNSINLSVQGDHTQFEKHEESFDVFRYSHTDRELYFGDYLHDLKFTSKLANIVTNNDNVFRALLANGDVFTATGNNLTKDEYTLTSYSYQSHKGINFFAEGNVNYSGGNPVGSFSELTVTDNREAKSISHHFIGEISTVYGSGTYSQHTISDGVFSVTYKGEMIFNDFSHKYESITYEVGSNKLEISNLPSSNIATSVDSYANLFHTITYYDNIISGSGLNDYIEAGNGNDTIIGGSGFDTVYFHIDSTEVNSIRNTKKGGTLVNSSEGIDTLFSIESLAFLDGTFNNKQLLSLKMPVFKVSKNGISNEITPTVYEGAVSFLEYQLLGDKENDIVIASDNNDFINLLGGDDAANGGAGDDVLDGGTGSNFLTGGGGDDTFFLDGRSGNPTWSTITDFSADEINIWGWIQGISNLVTSTENEGAENYKGATFHFDLNNDGVIETSITFTGLSIDQIPTSSAQTIEQNGYLLFS